MVSLSPHPLLDAGVFSADWPAPLGELTSPEWLLALLRPGSQAPLAADDAVRGAVRDLLRAGGFKPTGRSKPASEYLVKAVTEGTLSSINAVVDACNAASFHSGLPISVVDLDKVTSPLEVKLAPEGTRYVFNASGQEIDVANLLCLFDAAGPCANAVKDAQRTKTGPATKRTLSIVWGTKALPGRTSKTVDFYRGLLERLGATVSSG